MATDGDWEYNYDEEYGATITGYTGSDTDVIIPSTIGDNYPVTELDMTFASNHSITSVVVPEGVTSIGSYTFETCESLASVTLPSTLTTIGETAFARCTSLESITIPAAVESMWAQVFLGCTSLTEITFLGETAPQVDYDTFSMGTYETEVTCTIYSPDNALDGAFDEYVPEYTTLLYDAYQEGLFYEKLTWNDEKIQVESAIRDGNGVRIDTNYQRKPAVYERTTNSSRGTTCALIRFSASDYKANDYLAHFRFRIKSKLQDQYASYGECIVNYSYTSANAIYIPQNTTSLNTIISSLTLCIPSGADIDKYFIAFTTNRESTDFIIEMVDADVPYVIPETMTQADMSGVGQKTIYPGNWGSSYSLMWTGSAIGQLSGKASSATAADSSTYTVEQRKNRWGTYSTKEHSLCGISTEGAMCKLLTSEKKFPLPIRLMTPQYTGATANSAQPTRDSYNTAILYSYLSNSSYQGGNGYTCPTLSASDGGKSLFVRGALDTVDNKPVFVPDGNITLSMEAGYTYIPFGEVYKSSSSAPTYFYWKFENTIAYTLDADGKLTHIDGQLVGGGFDFIVGNTFTLTETD